MAGNHRIGYGTGDSVAEGRTDVKNERFNLGIVVAAIVFVSTAGSAEAAKGVKKNNAANTPRVVTGQILNVKYNNGGGSIFLKTPQTVKNVANGQKVAPNANPGHEFIATNNTRLVNYNGTPGNPTSLQRGVRVRLTTTGTNTSAIQILTHSRARGHVVRSGTNRYFPHMMNHTVLHPHHHRRR